MTETNRLSRADLHADPYEQFSAWFESAKKTESSFAEAMTLATSTPEGRPSARMVLLRSFDNRGFVFYTNYRSRKAGELLSNPFAALVFYWHNAGRQVRIEGMVSATTDAESDAYFQTRPRGSRLSAWASEQSSVVRDRSALEAAYETAAEKFTVEVPRPPNWGGFRLQPARFEFWQSRENRLHDRFVYTAAPDNQWSIERLAP